MIILVIIGNFLLTLGNLYLAWRIWRWQGTLARVTATLTRVERNVHHVLSPAPVVISKTEKGTHRLRQRYQQLQLQLENFSKILALLTLVARIWQKQALKPSFAKLASR